MLIKSVNNSIPVIWRLSPDPAISTLFYPSFAIVHCDTGTMWRPVWSQLIMRDGGFNTLPHDSVFLSKILIFHFQSFLLSELFLMWYSSVWPTPFYSWDRAQARVISMWPPFSSKSDRSADNTTPRPAALTTAVLMTPLDFLIEVTKRFTRLSS